MLKHLSTYLTIIFLALSHFIAGAQELNCTVEVNTDKVQGTNREVFETLREAIADYMNTTKFSNAQIATNERIDCRLFLTVSEYNDGVVTGDLQIQSTRPVYNSTYTSTIFNFKDNKIEFPYQQGEPLVFSLTTMDSNLTALLNFYAFLIMALDFDTFSPLGGQVYLDQLQYIVQLAQSSGYAGWKVFEDNRNRAALLGALTEPSTSVYRNLLYDYHRRGLDEMSVSPDKGRAAITETVTTNLAKIQHAAPMSVALTIFRDAKLDELVNIYSKGSQTERESVYNLLRDIYPTEESRLINIKNPPQQR